MNMAALAMRTKQPAMEERDAGMIKLVVPIFIGNESEKLIIPRICRNLKHE